jgi:hypothetical protein
MGAQQTKNADEQLKQLWQTLLRIERGAVQPDEHPPGSVLYDLALGQKLAEQEEETRRHVADCDECRTKLTDLQAAIETDKKVRAVWSPKVVRAAGGGKPPALMQDVTEDGKYLITLQATREGKRVVLKLEVTPSFQQELEGQTLIIVSDKGSYISRGTISGGKITSLIDQKFRDEWPFRVHAG